MGESIFNYTSDKRLISKLYKELFKILKKPANQQVNKWSKHTVVKYKSKVPWESLTLLTIDQENKCQNDGDDVRKEELFLYDIDASKS